jgi:hypothetical protein
MARPLIDLHGKVINGATVTGRNHTEIQTQTKWNLRCNHCGAEFVAGYKQLLGRRHSHVCDGEPKSKTFAATKRDLRQAVENHTTPAQTPTSLSFTSIPMASRPPRIVRTMTAAEIGRLHAQQYAMGGLVRAGREY